MAASTTKDFGELFVRLRSVMEPFGTQLVVTRDAPGDYYVETEWVRDDDYHGELRDLTERGFVRLRDAGAEAYPAPRWFHPAR